MYVKCYYYNRQEKKMILPNQTLELNLRPSTFNAAALITELSGLMPELSHYQIKNINVLYVNSS